MTGTSSHGVTNTRRNDWKLKTVTNRSEDLDSLSDCSKRSAHGPRERPLRARFEKTRTQADGTTPYRSRYPGGFAVKVLKQADLGKLQRLPLFFQICGSPRPLDLLHIFHHHSSSSARSKSSRSSKPPAASNRSRPAPLQRASKWLFASRRTTSRNAS
jgi:hypothetical protein